MQSPTETRPQIASPKRLDYRFVYTLASYFKPIDLVSGIYIHIPYCKQACYYCDFHFSTSLQNKQQMVEALKKELKLRTTYLSDPVIHTLYFGGGTPSLLDSHELADLIEMVRETYQLAPNAELTLEANPDDLTTEKLTQIKALGVNRLSIGVQSFDDEILQYFNRSHDSSAAITSIREAQGLGIENISIDLIFGVPNQTRAMLQKDLDMALSLDTPHISIYGLTIEEDTVFGKWHQQNKLTPMDDDLAGQHLMLIMETLSAAGYEQYEVSNFSKPGWRSHHNSSYWSGTHYLGIGPAAHSYDGDSRQYNVSHNTKYIKALKNGELDCEIETLSQKDKITEFVLTQIRKSEGINLEQLRRQLDYDLQRTKAAELSQLLAEQLVYIEDNSLTLTQKGKLLGDWVTEQLIP
ncbi:radical SAM family heme chaperone HemW [Reichenbachiella agariperforans]|uniref:radical SAM family heme chaperone HemW n=1 Tax=Reichenbachiella agariperforans TaxID=156994 RepID=UPI00338F7BC2